MKIIKLSSSNCDVYSEKLAQYIYESVKNSAFEKFCTYQEAVEKYSELKGYLQQNQTISHAAIKDNELIGFIWAYKYSFRDDKNRIYVSALHVDSEYRGQGIGEKLLQKVEDEAKRLGCSAVFLHTEAFNDGALRFYDRMGYHRERVQLAKKIGYDFQKKDENYSNKKEDVLEGRILSINSEFVFQHLSKLANMYLDNVLAHIFTEGFLYVDAVKKMKDLANYLDEEKAYTYCFCIEDKIAGIVWAYPYKFKDEERLYIGEIQVNAEYRGKKIGHQLYSEVLRKMNELDIKTLYTHVDAVNLGSLKFHSKQGFRDEVYQMVKAI